MKISITDNEIVLKLQSNYFVFEKPQCKKFDILETFVKNKPQRAAEMLNLKLKDVW